MSSPTPPPNDAELRKILDDVAAGRTTVDQAQWQIKNLLPTTAQAQALATMLGPMIGRQRNTAASAAGWIVGGILALIGTIFFCVGLFFSRQSLELLHGSAQADGVVTKMLHEGKGAKPVVKYSVDGKDYETIGKISTSPPAFHVGERVKVSYRIGDPSYAIIDSFVERWLFPLIFGGIGAVVGLIGWLILLVKFLKLLLRPFRMQPTDEAERFTVE